MLIQSLIDILVECEPQNEEALNKAKAAANDKKAASNSNADLLTSKNDKTNTKPDNGAAAPPNDAEHNEDAAALHRGRVRLLFLRLHFAQLF